MILLRFVLIALLLSAMPAIAQTYPTKPIRIIAAVAPGSGPDIISRLIGGKLTEAWRQQVVIDNRAGAGGNLGAGIAARAAPDGYTLLMITASQAIAATLFPKLNYDLIKDFTPISLLASTPYLLVVNNSVPATSLPELIALAKAKPGSLRYGSGGSGSPPHLAAEMLRSQAGIELLHVPYKSIAPALTELGGGQIHLVISVASTVLPLTQSGKLRALAVTSAKRTPLAPALPTFAETLPGYQLTGWYGLVAPAGTPAAIVARVHEAATRAVKSAEVQERLATLGAEATGSTPAEFAAHLRAEIQRLGKAVRDSGARAV
jgi:tripartite-type tricarboxylate transporter receptor subunit TctC